LSKLRNKEPGATAEKLFKPLFKQFIEYDELRRRCKMNNMETHLQFAALKEVTDIGNINALVKRCA
jgi:hypothetical protein